MVSIKKLNNPESSDSTLGEIKMANRIGKYKVTKREAELSAVDGATISGNLAGITDLSTSGTNTFTGLTTTTGVNQAPVTLTPAASVTLTKAANSGRLNLIPSVATGNDEYILPVAAAAGETYEIAWSGIAADADDILFVAPTADALTFTGGILQFDTDATDASGYTIAFPASADDDKLTIVNPESFCIKFVATTTTNYHVSGYAMSTDTAVAFGDL